MFRCIHFFLIFDHFLVTCLVAEEPWEGKMKQDSKPIRLYIGHIKQAAFYVGNLFFLFGKEEKTKFTIGLD